MTHPAADLLRAIADGKQMERLKNTDWVTCTAFEALELVSKGCPKSVRIARPMLTVTYSVPVPVKGELRDGERCWLAGFSNKPTLLTWGRDQTNTLRWLREGRIYLTQEDAQAAIDARNKAFGEAMK